MRNNIKIIWILFAFISCNDILDESPDNRTEIDSLDKIRELLVAAYPEALYAPFLEPMSDNAGDRTVAGSQNNEINEDMWYWKDLNSDALDTPINYWNAAYKAISQANQALEALDNQGFANIEERGEALLCRAYAHYMLVNIFARAYNTTTSVSDLGVTYITKPETTLLPTYTRNTVEEVYNFIEADLVEGLELVGNNYEIPGFHFTKKAAYAFASRFYLTIGDWKKVVTYSTLALGVADEITILRDITNGYNPLTLPQQEQKYGSAIPVLEPSNLLVVVGGSLFARTDGTARFQLSEGIREIVFRNSPLGTRWSYGLFSNSTTLFTPKYSEYFKFTNQAAGIGNAFVQLPLFTTDEAILNRAEANAMLGNFQLCADDLNAVLTNKVADFNASDTNLTATTDDPSDDTDVSIPDNFAVTDTDLYAPFYTIPTASLPYVNLTLNIRRTVFFNEGLRWFDVKRHHIVVVHEEFAPDGRVELSFELPRGDDRRALQIPADAQSLGIQKNPRQ